MTRFIQGPGAPSRSSTVSRWRAGHGEWLLRAPRSARPIDPDGPVSFAVTAVCVSVRWNVTARLLMVLLSSSKNVCLKLRIRTRFTFATCVAWWPSPTHGRTPTNVVAAATKPRYLFDSGLAGQGSGCSLDTSGVVVLQRQRWWAQPLG